jgi:hypothetical protein
LKFVGKIELCEMPNEEVAGRAKIKMSALKISKNDNDNNENGINWTKENVLNNIKSFIGASYKVAFLDDEKTYPSGHGDMEYDDEGNVIFPNSDTVGSIQDAYIENMVVDNETCDLLTTEGFIYRQSYPNFYNWLKEECKNGTVYGSVEINGKGSSKNIVYDGESKNKDGTPKIGRKPKIFDGVAVAILSDFVPPADKFSRVLEINSKEGKVLKKVKTTQKIEINELSFDDIATLVTRAFNAIMSAKDFDENHCSEWCYKYYPYKIYPQSHRIIMYDYSEAPCKYLMTTYTVNNNDITIGEITKVEQDWKPIDNEQEAEINASLIKNILTKQIKEVNLMDEKVILELNQKIENKTIEINELNTKNTEITAKNAELNEAVVNASKTLEEANSKVASLTEELNTCKQELSELKAEKEKAESEKKKVEVNSYFETEIPKNGFVQEEINSLKHFVDEVDLEGLKSAESELCTKKFKELKAKETDKTNVEINSATSNSFISIHEKERKVISDATDSFFN